VDECQPLMMGSCHVGHDCTVGNNNVLSNHTLLVSILVAPKLACQAPAPDIA